ncbi:L-histidine N(alpha)-methyltransferase [Streptomyces albus]|uniref:L-histidine N(alpha)-methyltransferase n=1 Tax=Streptomyces albus TaxID=1888 RepID=UPI0013B49EB1|nr:L-histidine N(alpha)-methyltransferase [Streptomyces albus]QID39554.1 L-histidine N(alpha)-methyltransferase [Streptomyces albus]
MSSSRFILTRALPQGATAAALASDVADGFAAVPKALPPRWFYDARGSELFEEITTLPEYYPTRAEHRILTRHAGDIARLTGARTLVELGSGSSLKTRLLLDALPGGLLYVPVDVSESALEAAGHALLAERPGLRVHAVVADFRTRLRLPACPGPRLVAFLGGTIGNLLPPERRWCCWWPRRRPGDGGLLRVLARELGADCDPDDFDHVALWDAEHEWIEMRLRARSALSVKVPALNAGFDFRPGEELRTEISAKFRPEGVRDELTAGGWRQAGWWTDPEGRFALSLAFPRA